MDLSGLLEPWNPWWDIGEIPISLRGIERDVLYLVKQWINSTKKVKCIIGPRRSGKTTLLYQLIDVIIKTYSPTSAIYVNFDDPEISEYSLKDVISAAKRISGGKTFLFLDEIQRVRNWERWLKALLDRESKVSVFISGSTLSMLSKNFSKKLAGRSLTFFVYPFSILEAARASGINWKDPRDMERLVGLVENILEFGLYPEIFLEKDPNKKKRFLLEYYNTIVARDIAAANELDIHICENLAKLLFKNAGSRTSVNKLSKLLKVSFHTANAYVNAFLSAFVLFEVRKFSYSFKEQIAFPRKFYPIDVAFQRLFLPYTPDYGRRFESFVASELFKAGYSLYYFLNKRECDFVLEYENQIKHVLQVCYKLTKENKARELEGLKAAEKEFSVEGNIIEFNANGIKYLLNLLSKNAKVFI